MIHDSDLSVRALPLLKPSTTKFKHRKHLYNTSLVSINSSLLDSDFQSNFIDSNHHDSCVNSPDSSHSDDIPHANTCKIHSDQFHIDLDNKQPNSPPNLPGTPVVLGHSNYMLMYDMLTGIRVSVSRCHSKPYRDLTPSDFGLAHKLAFDISGTEVVPASVYAFKFKDYCPWVFRSIRSMFNITASDYLASLTGRYVMSEMGSSGKSKSFFYFSRDYRFIIKTVSKCEHLFFRKILPFYYDYVVENPDTLITRIFGVHRVKLPGGKKIRFVVMGNVFPCNRDIHSTYDLKGSTIGRITKNPGPRSTLKDLNFISDKKKIALGPVKRTAFLCQIQRDVEFLASVGCMDYSLLVGCHDLEKGNSFNIRTSFLSMFTPRPSAASPATVRRSKASAFMMSLFDKQDGGRQFEPSRAVLPETTPPEKEFFKFYKEGSGYVSSKADDSEGDEVYYLGIIDIFTEFNFIKKIENFFKSFGGRGKEISAVEPSFYGKRFFEFIRKGVTS